MTLVKSSSNLPLFLGHRLCGIFLYYINYEDESFLTVCMDNTAIQCGHTSWIKNSIPYLCHTCKYAVQSKEDTR